MRISDQQYNQLLVLKTIRRLEPIARTELARQTGLAGGTITKLIGNLIARGMVVEESVRRRAKGRPQVHLRINPEAGYVVGAWISASRELAVEIVNFQGVQVFSCSLKIQAAATLEALATEVAGLIEVAIADSPIHKRNISRVGITLPAMVDYQRGLVRWMVTFPPGPVPFAHCVQRVLDVPVVIDSVTNVMARGEHWFGTGEQLDDFMLVNLDIGMGAAWFSGGALWSGANGINPEFAHVKVEPEDGLRCYCGARGCLGSYVSLSGIQQQLSRNQAESGLAIDPEAMKKGFANCVERADSGDADAFAVFEKAGHLLGVAVANQVNARDPGRVIIAGFEASLIRLIKPSFLAAIERHTLPALRDMTTFELQLVNEEILWRGAASLGLEQTYLG